MSFEAKSTHIDRDDFDADHYADFIRDTHRSRLTLEQLDIAQRQLRRKEKSITHIHDLKMKEHMRIKHDFIRKIEQDKCLSNLPIVKQSLKVQRRKGLESSSMNSNDNLQEITKQIEKSHQFEHHSKTMIRPDSPRTERLKSNLDKFNHINTLLC